MFYLCSENEGTDQLCSYRTAGLHLCFCLCKNLVFPLKDILLKHTINSYKHGVLFMGHIGKQHSPRCDAAECGVPSGAILLHRKISSKNEIEITPNTPKNERGLIQLIMMVESIRQIWVR